MLYCLMDGHARTSTELAIVADVATSTASAHLGRLLTERLVNVAVQGKHRYFSLAGANVANVLEGLNVLAGGPQIAFEPNTPHELRFARTCYDHLAGTIAVLLHDRFVDSGWLHTRANDSDAYDVSAKGTRAFLALGIDVDAARALRRRFAYPCLDWSERRPHVAGAIGAEILDYAVKKRWLMPDGDTRALYLTRVGERGLRETFGLQLKASEHR